MQPRKRGGKKGVGVSDARNIFATNNLNWSKYLVSLMKAYSIISVWSDLVPEYVLVTDF
jgi:hypothetical protein